MVIGYYQKMRTVRQQEAVNIFLSSIFLSSKCFPENS